MKPPGRGHRLESEWLLASGFRVLRPPPWRVNRAGVPEPLRKRMRASRPRGSCPPLSAPLEGAPPARQRALNTRAGPKVPRARHLRLPLAATQPVDGACLIRRYRAVRLRGGPPRRDSSVGQSAAPITRRSSVRCRLSLRGSGQDGKDACLISRKCAGSSRTGAHTAHAPLVVTGYLAGPSSRRLRVRAPHGARSTWPHRLWVRIRGFHPRERGSTPRGATDGG